MPNDTARAVPDGNHGDKRDNDTMAPKTPIAPIPAADRQRLSLDLAPAVSLLLDHVSEVTGTPKSQLVTQALLDALPAFLERSEALQKRAAALQQANRAKR